MGDKYESNNLVSGRMVGNYRIKEKIGSGGMGEVYLALDTKLNRNVAIKVLLNELLDDIEKNARFKREAMTAASINHANVMGIYDIDEAVLDSNQKINFIVMEYIEGVPLGEYLATKENKSTSELLRIAEKLSSGLVAAHKVGVIHRDIKMSNIIINKDDVPKILDFGLAKPIDALLPKDSSNEFSEDTESVVNDLTQEGKIVGTISYMSPEQARGTTVDVRSDIFSLGVLFYRMFSERFPFEGSDNVSIIAKILETPHTPVRSVRANLPNELDRIINKCLQKQPGDRYQNTHDLMLDLRNLRKQFDSGISDSITGTYDYKKHDKRTLLQKPITLLGIIFSSIAVILSLYFVDPFDQFISIATAKTNSLAVLSFENLSDPNDTDRYGQILQELLITDLSGNSQLRVVSSQRLLDIQKKLSSVNQSKIDPSIAAEVAKHVGAVTMLSGNLINTGQEWIVTGQLIDVENGTVIKSHRFKGSDFYAVVDSLSSSILSGLSVPETLVDSEVTSNEKSSISIDAYRHYFSGIDYLGETDYKSAIEEFRKAVALDQDFSRAYYKLTIALWWLNDLGGVEDTDELLEVIKKREYTSKQDELLVKAALALYERRYHSAQFAYQELATLYPDDKEVWYGLGEALFHDGNKTKQESLVAFEKAIELDATFVLAYRHIFELYYSFEMFEKASQTARALVKAKPESLMGYRYLAASSILLRDSSGIQETEEEALRHHTSEEELLGLYDELIVAYTEIDEYDIALDYAKRALALDSTKSSPQLIPIWEVVIRNYESSKQTQAADSVYDVALASNVPLTRKLNMLTNRIQQYFANVHTRKRAHIILDKGLDLDSTESYANLYAVAAQLYLVERDYEMSAFYAGKAIKVSGSEDIGWAKQILFQSVFYSGDYRYAEELAQESLGSSSTISNDYRQLVRVYIFSGEIEKAERLISSVLEKDSTLDGRVFFLTDVSINYKIVQLHEKAIELLLHALTLEPDNYSTISELARCYTSKGEYNEGERYAKMLLDQAKFSDAGLMALVRSHLIQNKTEQASQWISKLNTDSAPNLRMHGYFHSVAEDYDSAFYYADSAHEINQQFFSINLLAWTKVAGDIDIDGGIQMAIDAINSPLPYNQLDTYIHESPFVPLPQQTLALGYFKKNDFETAKKYYEEAVKLRPDDNNLQAELRRCLEKMKS